MPNSLHDDRYREIIRMLTSERKKQEITQKQLSELVHLSQSHLSKIENYERRIDVLEFFEIIVAMNINIHSFFDNLLKGLFLNPKKANI